MSVMVGNKKNKGGATKGTSKPKESTRKGKK